MAIPEGDTVTVIGFAQAQHGTVSMSTSGSFTYEPDPGYTGPDEFEYRISDGTSSSTMVTVTLTVLPSTNRPPHAATDHYFLPRGEVLSVFAAEGLLHNDLDREGDPLTVLNCQAPAHGILNPASDGSFTYTPDPGFEGVETLAYTITDGTSQDTGTLIIEMIGPSNRPPVAQTDWYYTPKSVTLTIGAAAGLLRNDVDQDGDWFGVASVSAPDHGILNPASDGSFTYTPDPGFEGVEIMEYDLVDSGGAPGDHPGGLRILVGVYGDIPSGVITPPTPDGFALLEPFPNPFNPRTEIAYRTVTDGHVALRILDLRGRVVATLVDGVAPAGERRVAWNGQYDTGGKAAGGVYVAELRQGALRGVRKLTLLK